MSDRVYRVFNAGGVVTGGPMPRVDHYEREQVLMPNGSLMCQMVPVFEIETP